MRRDLEEKPALSVTLCVTQIQKKDVLIWTHIFQFILLFFLLFNLCKSV